ncbi:non-ribosomal peptide synthetase [Dictyobacter kobayashii]|uniref:Carrier domain-containing protein n=1 Tax=Dictyobacter kobayashii TaxID=2014872 RepID=A0A402ASL7_9CHLR|nr:non-ribosomal peptide synthetase [Dictyobacter kobayashii]GCE22082.1 hypothetical protein KDK_58820 [Dictyobacter kobayashii]
MTVDRREKIKNLSPEKHAQLLELLREKGAHTRTESIPLLSRDEVLPLSFAQERMWFLDQMEPGNAFYNISIAIRLRGALQPDVLERCFNTIIERHESLRTTFARENGQVKQVITPQLVVSIPVQDVSGEPADRREDLVQQQARRLAQHSFDLVYGPLVQAQFFRLQPDEHVLVLILHHSIADGWSMGVLVQELSELYDATIQGKPVHLPALPLQYADYAAWQRERLQEKKLERHLAYWKEQLESAPALLELPTDHPRPPVQSYRGAKEAVALSLALSQAIKRIGQQMGMTPYMVLLAGWATLLGRLSNQDDLVIGSPIAGRQRKELEGLIGFFINTLPLRIDLSGYPTFRQVLERIRTMTLAAYEHQELPFDKIVEELAPQRDLSHQPLLNIVFILQNMPVTISTSVGLSIEPVTIDNNTAKYDVLLSMSETSQGQFTGFLEYCSDLFEQKTVQRWLQQWQNLLAALLHDIDQPIAAAPLVSEQEQWLLQQRSVTHPEALPAELRYLLSQHDPSERIIYQVLDDQGHLCPPGVIGELHLVKPEALSTGELVRYRVDATLEYVCHRNELVAKDSFRLNLHEIETQLVALPEVRDSAIALIQDPEANSRSLLVAYLVRQGSVERTQEQLRTLLKKRLPGYKIPRHFIWIEAIPRSGDGKIERTALPDPTLIFNTGPATIDGPRTPLEETLVRIWQEVLQVEQVGIHDNFFELGGHSLLATQVVARLGEALGEQGGSISAELEGVLISALFEEPTIAALAGSIEENGQQDVGEQVPELQAVDHQQDLPLSFTQERVWFLHQLESNSASYNISAAVRLLGPLQVPALEQSLNALIERHESLRTTFISRDGQPRQCIAPYLKLSLPLLDLSQEDKNQREQLARQWALADAQKPFDLQHGPLLRRQLIRLNTDEHVLVLTIHHIVSDGWSMSVMMRELSILYAGYAQGEPVELPALPIQYADYAVWQRAWLQGALLEQQIEYWQSMLVGTPELLELPTDRPRPPVQSHRGAKAPVRLSPQLSQAIKRVSQQQGVTPYMVLLASWSILLGRLSGQQDLVIGSPIAGRKRVELEGLIGFFVNTLALRIDLSGEPSFRQVLERLREVALGAYAHQELPFEKLVEELAPGRDLSYQPLFQTMFILQNTPRALTTFSDLRMQPLEVDNQTAKFDLTLELYDLEHTFEGSLEYMSDLFAPATIQRWLAQWQCLLTAALQAPEHPIATLPLEPEAQLRQRWADWNACAHPLPEAQDLVALFRAQVRQRPEGVALLSEGATLTYRQLNAQANQLAHRLLAAGLELEGRVGVYLPRTPQLVVALLAILKAGGAYVPLDPGLPEERVRWMVRDAQVQYVLSSSALCPQPLEPTVPWWWLDRLAEEELPELDPARAIEPQQLAYLLYTSGSTGEPKGVMGTHQGIINRLAWAWRAYPFAAGEVCCQKTSLSFVDAVAELFTPLLAGVPTVLATQQHCQDAAELLRLLAQHRVSRLVLVPSLLRTLLALEPKLGERLPALRLWMCSGEALPAELCERFQAELPDRVLLNIYGSSEVAADATAWPVQAGEYAPAIGRPLDRVRVYVLDPAGQPVPVGVSGEIYVGGPGLARGYAGQAGQTAERFVPDEISGQEGARLYRTGDLGRYRADGVLEYVGRVDQQIKLRGIRIEVAEIERWMQQAPGVQRAVVVVLEQASGEAWLVGCVQARTGQDVDVEQVRHTLKQRVPGYMVPQRYVKVEQIPLTSSGKVDRQRLRRQVEQEQGAQEQERYREPETPVEQEVARIWEEVLRTQRVGRYDNFFERGGHSLLATQVAARIRDRFQVALPLQRLFEVSTLYDLASVIVQEQISQIDSDTLSQMFSEVTQMSLKICKHCSMKKIN